MSAKLTIFVLCLYVALFNFYIFELTGGYMTVKECKVFYNCITLCMLLFVSFDYRNGFYSYWHLQFNAACFISLVINYILIILTHLQIINSPKDMFILFNGLIFVSTIVLFISLGRHGYLKDEN